MEVTIQSKFLKLNNNLNIHMLEAGKKGNPPVVLLHGYPASCYIWRHCIAELAKDYHLFAPDLPGHGKSDKPLAVDYDLAFLTDFLKDYLNTVGLTKAHIICHDFGALAGFGLVCAYPQDVKSLVVMDTGPYADWPVMARLLIYFMKNRWLTNLLLNKHVYTLLFRHLVFSNPKLATQDRMALFRDPWVRDKFTRKAFRRTIEAPLQQLVVPEDKIRNIRVPTLILWAEGDTLFPPSIAHRLHGDIADSSLRIVPNSGHFLQEEQPDIVVGHIREFLAENLG